MIYGTPDFAQLLKELIKDDKRHELYEPSCEHAREMGVHINGDHPLFLLERNRPREDDETKVYRIGNYEPTTKAGADKAIKIVSKGFNPSLYSIVWPENSTEAEELETYTMKEYPRWNSIINFNKDVVLRKMLADPNGLLAVKPSDMPGDDTETVKPITVVYGSSANWWYDRDCYIFCVSVVDGDDKEKIHTFEYYDKNQFVLFEAYYDESEQKKQVIITELEKYQHNGGKIPVWYLGGESKNLDNGKVLYQSYFSAALPHWNLAVKHGSDLMASIVGHIFPQKYEVAEECAFSREIGGVRYGCNHGTIKIRDQKGDFFEESCPQCSGTGMVSVKGPLQTYQFLREKLAVEGGASLPPVGFIDVPIDATKFLDEYTDKMNQKAMWAINMDVEDKVGEIQSGIAKTIDRSAQNDTVSDIISREFDVHIPNQYKYTNMYLNSVKAESTGKDAKKFLPEVNKPTQFDLLTTSELVFNYKVSKDSGIDRNILRMQAAEIVKSKNGSSPALKNYQIALIELDPLFGCASEEIDLGVSKGVIRKVDWTTHENVKAFVDQAIENDAKFLSKKRSEQKIVIEKLANELIAAEKPRIDEAIMMTQDQFNEEQNAA